MTPALLLSGRFMFYPDFDSVQLKLPLSPVTRSLMRVPNLQLACLCFSYVGEVGVLRIEDFREQAVAG